MSKINALLKQRFQARMNKLSARVTQRPVDDVGRGVGYLICEVGGVGGVKVMVPPDSVYYPGDSILVEQRGTPALAFYTVLGWETGARPTAGMIEFTGDTTVGNTTYPAGDLLWGNPYAAHFHMDYDAGTIDLRYGSEIKGQINAASGLFIAGDPTDFHGEFSGTDITFRNAVATYGKLGLLDGDYGYAASGSILGAAFGVYGSGSTWIGLDSASGFHINLYDQVLGRFNIAGDIQLYSGSVETVHLDSDGSGWLAGASKLTWDAVGNLGLGTEGVLLVADGDLSLSSSGLLLNYGSESITRAITWMEGASQRGRIICLEGLGSIPQIDIHSDNIMLDATEGVGSLFLAGNISQYSGALDFNAQSGSYGFQIRGSGDDFMFYGAAASDLVGVGLAAPTGKLHVKQSISGSRPALTLEQAAVDREFVRFIGTSASGENAQSLLVSASLPVTGSLMGWLKIYVQDNSATSPLADTYYYLPFYNIPTSS